MKTTRDWQTIALATIATILVAASLKSSLAAQGEGARYGARDPLTCADRTAPKTGAPSVAQATKYFICDAEMVFGSNLYLVDDVKIQLGKGRKYNPNEDINMPGIDTATPVYPIRGSYLWYSCAPIRPDHTNLNRNCTVYSQPKASGVCYKNDFGDWKCKMVDVHAVVIKENSPPPGATTPKPAPAAAKPDKNAPDQTEPPAGTKKRDTAPASKGAVLEAQAAALVDAGKTQEAADAYTKAGDAYNAEKNPAAAAAAYEKAADLYLKMAAQK